MIAVPYPRTRIFLKLLLCSVLLLATLPAFAQEEQQVVQTGRHYLDLNIRGLDKYSRRVERQQKILLTKLKRKEQRFARQLNEKDSAAYARYKSQPLNYDSISRLLHPDSTMLATKTKNKANKVIDSLRGVQSFIQTNAAKAGINNPELSKYNAELSGLQQKLDYNEYINGLISQHTNSLKGLGTKANIPALEGIEKNLQIGKSKMAAWKQIADDPSKLEEKALEYLQGTKGFDRALNKATTNANSMQAGMSGDDLEKMGFQTRSSVSKALQQKLGGNLGQVQQQMGEQVKDWQSKTQGALAEVKQAKADIKQATQQAKNIQKPSLHLNPMRGKPLWQRIEKGYNFQTNRATTDGKPAMLQLAGTAGFKWSPKLTTGVGIATSFGLGKDWSHIHFSFEGVGLRTFAEWKWTYGIGIYGGYERTYKQIAFTNKKETGEPLTPSVHNTATRSDAALLGLSKTYRLNSKWNGAIQVLYDLWWREKILPSPIQLRFTTTTKQ